MAMSWYGPMIDLSRAASHLDDYVQLLVLVRSSQPLQKHNASRGGSSKTNIQVGDDTRSYFPVSVWQKHMGSMIVVGDVILLQNVKIVKYRDVLEATTNQISAVVVLIHSYELNTSKGTGEVVPHCQLGETARAKLRRVVGWVQQTESTFHHLPQVDSCQKTRQPVKNWKADEEIKLHHCSSISEVLCITTFSKASFLAGINEMCLPFTRRTDDADKEHMFLEKRLSTISDNTAADDLICTGCKLCGSPMNSRSLMEPDKATLYCPKSSKYVHNVCQIYRPFILYVSDETGQIPVLVKNRAAEILFGNITAENVYKSFHGEQNDRTPSRRNDSESTQSEIPTTSDPASLESAGLTDENRRLKRSRQTESSSSRKMPNFYHIWLILIKSLLQQGKNSPFRFEVAVDVEKDLEKDKFELISFAMPCYRIDEVFT